MFLSVFDNDFVLYFVLHLRTLTMHMVLGLDLGAGNHSAKAKTS